MVDGEKHGEFYGELRVRFGSVQGAIATLKRRYSAMVRRLRSVWSDGLLIRRSWVRNPPGSHSQNVVPLPRISPLPLGSFTGNFAPPDPYANRNIWLIWGWAA